MASPSPNASFLPRWRQALFNVPEPEWCASQKELIRGLELSSFVFETMQAKPTVDPRSFEAKKALAADVEIQTLLQGNYDFVYALEPEKAALQVQRAMMDVAHEFVRLHSTVEKAKLVGDSMYLTESSSVDDDPENIVLECLGALYLACVRSRSNGTKQIDLIGYMALLRFTALPECLRKKEAECDTLLQRLGTKLTSAHLLRLMSKFYRINLASHCLFCEASATVDTPTDESGEVGERLANLIELFSGDLKYLAASREPLVSFHANLGATVHTMRFQDAISGYKKVPTLFPELVKNVELNNARYLVLLQRALNEAEDLRVPDPLMVARLAAEIQRRIAIGFGDCVRYTELESLIEKQEKAMEACRAWTPPFFRKRLEQQKQITVNTILPLLQRLAPTNYRTVKLSGITRYTRYAYESYYTTEQKKFEKVCEFCGTASVSLSLCGGCKGSWFCNADCQRAAWAGHKAQCKAAQHKGNKKK